MTAKDLDAEIDRLFQLPLPEFTGARNALAKELAGDAARRVKALGKPSQPAWIVNQLYWRKRPTYDALIRAAERLRSAHRAALEGKKTDLKAVNAAHQAALRKALHDAGTILTREPTGPVLQGVTQTLEALPIDVRPGRLEKPLEPSGFEILAGLTPRAMPRGPFEKTGARRESKSSTEHRQNAAATRKQAAAARTAVRHATAKHREAVAAFEKHSTRLAHVRQKEEQLRDALEQTIKQREALERDTDSLERAMKEATRKKEEVGGGGRS